MKDDKLRSEHGDLSAAMNSLEGFKENEENQEDFDVHFDPVVVSSVFYSYLESTSSLPVYFWIGS